MLFDAPVAQKFAARMYELGVLVTGFFYPVVPKDQARIRVQLSAAHERKHLDKAIQANEAELRNFGDPIAKRITIYRDMRQRFSQLADPKPAAAKSGNVEEA